MSGNSLEQLRMRKPAKRVVEVPDDVREALSAGHLESKNLVEWLSIDRFSLLTQIVQNLHLSIPTRDLEVLRGELESLAALKSSQRIAKTLSEYVKVGDTSWKRMSEHSSDVVREWSALLLGYSPLPFSKKLAWVKPFADNENSGLREISWISLRNDVIADPENAIERLVPWTGSRSANLRRYASEITRPRGVWAAHIGRLKEEPSLALKLLEPLRGDDAKYVKDSVANWLNDASKSNPQWVIELTNRWTRESDSKHTEYIVRRALRTLNSKM